jgi:DNA-directed RNA polymerase specialized sigma24 family protein
MARRDDFEALMRAEYAGVLRLVSVVLGDDAAARDVTQEAFTRLYVHWDAPTGGSCPPPTIQPSGRTDACAIDLTK